MSDLSAAIARVRAYIAGESSVILPGDIPAVCAAAERAAEPTSVDCIGIALELEDRAKTVESQTTQRAMLAGARALRNLYARPPLAAPPASEPLNPPTAWDLQHRGASTEPRNGTSASEPQAVRNVDDLRDAGADAEQAAIDSLAEPQFDFARAIHYPEHWDMAAYPTLESAIWEALSCAGCSECYPPAEAAPAPKSVWLIERGQKEFHTPTIWYAADSKHPEDARYAGRWTENANRAVKFATQEECEQTVYNEFMRYWGDRRVNCHASEHVFLDRPPATHPRDRK